MSIVSVPGFESLLEARPVKINHLSSDGGSILFTCDRGGSNEAYRVDPASGKVLQLTSSKVGAKGAVRYGGGLLYTSVESGGVPVLYAPDAALRKEEADWNYRHEWIWAEKLSAQEEQLSGMSWEQMYPLVTSARKSRAFFSEGRPLEEIAGAEKTVSKARKDRKVAPARRRFGDPDASPEGPVEVSEPRSYNKLAHLVRVHSWVPAFIDYDEIASDSFEKVVTESSLGATALFQNTLGTLSGSAGVRLWQGKDRPFAGGQAQLNYYGFYPVLNATVDVGRSFARRYWVTSEDGTGGSGFAPTDVPLVASTLRAYVPWNLSSGGWIRGAIASVSWRITNDVTSTGVVTGRTDAEHFVVEGIEPGELKLRNRATVSARYYAMRPTATSRIYPELGIGVEAGCRFAPGLAAISLPVSYLYTYGYLPGLLRRHGIRLSAAIERQDSASVLKEAVVNFTPRGYAQIEGVYGTISSYPWRSGVTVDYAFPFADLGWDFLCPEVYVRNLEATLHADYTRLWGRGGGESLLSAGADLAFKLGNFLWVPYDTRLGVGWNWNAPLGKGTWNFIIDIAL